MYIYNPAKNQFFQKQMPPLMETVFIVLLFIPAISLEPHEGSCKIFKDDNNLLTKSTIRKWWLGNSLNKKLDCKHKITKNYRRNKLIESGSASEIKSFPCSDSTRSTGNYFQGKIQEGILEGDLEANGKLVFASPKEWSKLSYSHSKRKKVMSMKKLNACFKASDPQGRGIKEVIGTFKNGTLHGLTKVTYHDNSFYIGHYKNGKAHGYARTYDSEGNLIEAGAYYRGWEKGYHWKYQFGHLLYQNMERVNDNVSPTLVFGIASNGSLIDPIAGDYFPHSGTLTSIQNVHLLNILSTKSHCMLDIQYKLCNIENYTYSLSSKLKYPLFGQNEYHVLCKKTKIYDTGNVAKYLKNWISYITDLLEDQSIKPDMDVSHAPEILWQLRPEVEKLDVDKSIKLISTIGFCTDTKSMTATILGSRPIKIESAGGSFSVDNDLKLNGFNEVKVASEERQYVQRDKSLNWYPISIAGKFEHGVLNGISLITTNVSTQVWAMVRHGILHGPCVIYGISYIIDPVRSILKLVPYIP